MLLGKKRKLGRRFEDIQVGEKLSLTEKIEDKDLLLYLGLTNDANPLYIQHDYASQTTWKKPIVPAVMLTGVCTSALSKYLPGPGSHVLAQTITFHQPVYHYETVRFDFKVMEKNEDACTIIVEASAWNEEEEKVLSASFTVQPPCETQTMDGRILDNF